MPRPPLKRRRPNNFGNQKRTNIPDQSQVRQALERKVANKPVGKKLQDSDDSDGLVTTRTSGRNRKRQDLYASGAVAKGDEPGSYPTRAQARRALREDTDEILSQRSRSASRTTTPAPSSDKENNEKDKTDSRPVASTKKRGRDSSVQVNGTAPVSQPEASVLGNIKPRKRQASILRLIENDPNESSIVDSDDEDRFLPDAISTPVVTAKTVASPAPKDAPTSFKRKRGSDAAQSTTTANSGTRNDLDRITETPRKSTPPGLAPPSRTQQQKLLRSQARSQTAEDIMALPESSDDEDEVEIPQDRPRKLVKSQAVVAPSTSQLQNLMPSKNHVRLRKRPATDEFDIPDDPEVSDADENEHSTFVPSKSRKAQKQSKPVAKSGSKGEKTTHKSRNQAKSTNALSHTPSSVRIRTPLPLSSKKNGITQAKSPSKQGTAMRDKSANTPSRAKTAKGTKKQYGGSRRRAAGKENELISLSDDASTDNDAGDAQTTKKTHDTPSAADAKAWNRKWGDIDDFSLDFEDVSASTHSSSPNAR